MEYTTLGRSGMRVSRMGLGGGGFSQLGRRTGRSHEESVSVARRAIERGINFIDTAEGYGTEPIVGDAIRGHPRSSLFISTKKSMWGDKLITADELRRGLDESLKRLGTDYVDVYHLHGLGTAQYEHAVRQLVPEMQRLKSQGLIRAVGVTEAFHSDRAHRMFELAMVGDDCWDVIMVGFSILNQSARERVLAAARRRNVGVLCMFAVRAALAQPEKLRQVVKELHDTGTLRGHGVDLDDPLGFLVRDGVAESTMDAAYRFCRDEPGIHVVLSGTGNIEHLDQNIESLERPPLTPQVRQRLVEMFQGIDTVSGQ
jgi:aryl-alcohol dehydrogenase-like predicted oxidoreductase